MTGSWRLRRPRTETGRGISSGPPSSPCFVSPSLQLSFPSSQRAMVCPTASMASLARHHASSAVFSVHRTLHSFRDGLDLDNRPSRGSPYGRVVDCADDFGHSVQTTSENDSQTVSRTVVREVFPSRPFQLTVGAHTESECHSLRSASGCGMPLPDILPLPQRGGEGHC
jgi:hypothetical protein